MKSMLPENLLPKIEQAFKDFDIQLTEDLKDCELHLNPTKGTCFLHFKFVDQFNSGKLICTYKIDGTGFTWGKPYLHYFEEK